MYATFRNILKTEECFLNRSSTMIVIHQASVAEIIAQHHKEHITRSATPR